MLNITTYKISKSSETEKNPILLFEIFLKSLNKTFPLKIYLCRVI